MFSTPSVVEMTNSKPYRIAKENATDEVTQMLLRGKIFFQISWEISQLWIKFIKLRIKNAFLLYVFILEIILHNLDVLHDIWVKSQDFKKGLVLTLFMTLLFQ